MSRQTRTPVSAPQPPKQPKPQPVFTDYASI